MPPTDNTAQTGVRILTARPRIHLTASGIGRNEGGDWDGFSINGVTVNGTLTIYDNKAAAGDIVAGPFNLYAQTTNEQFPRFIRMNCKLTTGLYFSFAGGLAADITV